MVRQQKRELQSYDNIEARDLPGVAKGEPIVGELDLLAVADALLKDAICVAKAIASRGQVERRHRVHNAGSQATCHINIVNNKRKLKEGILPRPPLPRAASSSCEYISSSLKPSCISASGVNNSEYLNK